MTLSRHILESQRQQPRARGELSVVLLQLAFAGKITFRTPSAGAALDGWLGPTGERNVQGEATKKLDAFGNDTIVEAFARNELVAALVSEEMDEPRQIACGKRASYVLCVDPLDGSSNSDVNGVVATIFGVYRPPRDAGVAATVARVRSGRDQVAAGLHHIRPEHVLRLHYGRRRARLHARPRHRRIPAHPSPHPVPTAGPLLRREPGERADLGRPRAGVHPAFDGGGRSSLLTALLGRAGGRCASQPARRRIYLYPADRHHPDGKLRLAYECAPLAFVLEQAGGAASTGASAVLDTPFESIHQRVPFAAGSRDEVAMFERFICDRR